MGRPRGSGLVPLVDRFYSKVIQSDDPDGCWSWVGSVSRGGYGEMQVARSERPNGWGTKRATHISWFLEFGYWPTKWMLHKCHNGNCVNPDHLYEGTVLENNRDIHQRTRDLQELVTIQAEVIRLLLNNWHAMNDPDYQPGMLQGD